MTSKVKQRIFILSSKEISVLFLLNLSLIAFAFTLGIHLSKKLRSPEFQRPPESVNKAEAATENTPNQVELSEQSQNIEENLEQDLKRNLHDEVVKTGIKLKEPRQIHLPKNAKHKDAGATTLSESNPTTHSHRTSHSGDE